MENVIFLYKQDNNICLYSTTWCYWIVKNCTRVWIMPHKFAN